MGIETEMAAFLFAVGAVVLAEMGDKTQLLAMAFAAKYKASKVLIGVFIATVLNHGLAVWVGNLITHLESAQIWIQGAASLSFIFFGLWTIKGDKPDGAENKKTRFGPVLTVAGAFFIAEMGDKTQLATVALATKFPGAPLLVLAGTTLGMLVADGVGIIVGVVMSKRIPERIIKLISAGVFIIFGLIGSFEAMREYLGLGVPAAALITAALAAVAVTAGWLLLKRSRETRAIPLRKSTENEK
jgi:putative Ca2+/H+ antiporter (TMEM165/GDT1 family)